MPVRTCKASQQLANEAIQLILEDDQSIFLLDDMSISRMIVCGKCPISNVDYQQSKKAFRSSISVLANKIDHYNEWGYNPELTQERRVEASKNYRKEHKEEIKTKMQNQRMDQRIKQLKEITNGNFN